MTHIIIIKRLYISTCLVIILFISNIITIFIPKIGYFVLLYPTNLFEPWNWYRYFTYPLYVNGLINWLLNSICILCYGYLIEKRMKKSDLIGLILISTIIGGLLYTIITYHNLGYMPIASPTMISWGYGAASIVAGVKFWKTISLVEKIIFAICFLGIFSLYTDNLGILLSQISVFIIALSFTMIRLKQNPGTT